MKILIIGGSGFVSGTLARMAMERGNEVWTVTRGERELPPGAHGIKVDRKDGSAFEAALREVDVRWDVAVDCIGFHPDDAQQDLESVIRRCDHLLFVSTDFVYDPDRRAFPRHEDTAEYTSAGYGGNKREAELIFERSSSETNWTVLRPCHIYGPGSKLGCLPYHSRDDQLIARIENGEPLSLVGGGHFLQQPLFVEDLAGVILALGGVQGAFGQIVNVSGPDCIESREYYRIIASVLNRKVEITETPVATALAEHPEWKPFLCHRFYSKERLAGLVPPPATSIEAGIRRQVEWLISG
jgi:nucleoside-diphosphate-sugar epimerase